MWVKRKKPPDRAMRQAAFEFVPVRDRIEV
jgi:hypothetical protein